MYTSVRTQHIYTLIQINVRILHISGNIFFHRHIDKVNDESSEKLSLLKSSEMAPNSLQIVRGTGKPQAQSKGEPINNYFS